MKWLTLSSKVNRPAAPLRSRVRRPRKKDPAPANGGLRPKKGTGSLVLSLLVLAALVLGVRWYLYRSEQFAVETIEVVNYAAYSPEEVIELAGLAPGGNIFSLDSTTARAGIIGNRDFREAAVRKIFPNTVRIEVLEREPRARIVYGQTYTIDDQGVVLGDKKSGSERDLPVVRGLRVVDRARDLAPPEKRDACLRILQELEEQGISRLVRIEEINLSSSSQIELRADGRLRIILRPEDFRSQVSNLKTVLENLGTDLARARRIDLRYSRVPVSFRD